MIREYARSAFDYLHHLLSQDSLGVSLHSPRRVGQTHGAQAVLTHDDCPLWMSAQKGTEAE